jgi:hypothetical protein
MVRVFLIAQMPDASDKRSMTFRFRPIDRFFLSFKSTEHMVGMVFHYIILNGFKAILRTGFNVNVRHSLLSLTLLSAIEITPIRMCLNCFADTLLASQSPLQSTADKAEPDYQVRPEESSNRVSHGGLLSFRYCSGVSLR